MIFVNSVEERKDFTGLVMLNARKMLLIVLFLTTGLVVGGAYLLLNSSGKEPMDFRGIKWGSLIQDVKGMKLVGEEGDLKLYEKENDPLIVMDSNVDRIIYGFFKDRFYSVIVYFHDLENFTKLKKRLVAQLGDPFQASQQGAERVFWNGDLINLLLNFDNQAGSGRLAYFFKPIQLETEVGS